MFRTPFVQQACSFGGDVKRGGGRGVQRLGMARTPEQTRWARTSLCCTCFRLQASSPYLISTVSCGPARVNRIMWACGCQLRTCVSSAYMYALCISACVSVQSWVSCCAAGVPACSTVCCLPAFACVLHAHSAINQGPGTWGLVWRPCSSRIWS